eukprot:13276.XXX_883839_883967_1 [CDS] Oithona nana genome sequencing.
MKGVLLSLVQSYPSVTILSLERAFKSIPNSSARSKKSLTTSM